MLRYDSAKNRRVWAPPRRADPLQNKLGNLFLAQHDAADHAET